MAPRNISAFHQWLIFSVIATGIFLATSGTTVVNLALPFITDAFHSNISRVQWVLLGYLLTTSSMVINFGRLGDILGPFRVQTIGLVVFTLFSLLCSFSQSIQQLVTMRIFQAMGAAMIVSTGSGLITSVFPPEQRGRMLGLEATLVGVGLSVGPTLGGFLIGIFGWRAIFLYTVPIGIAGILLSRFVKAPHHERQKVHIDIPGSVLLFLSIGSFVLATDRARQLGWSNLNVLFLCGVFLLSFPGFFLIERLVPNPMLDLRLLKTRVFALAVAGNFLSFVAYQSAFFLLPFYLVQVLKLSAQTSGLILLPLTIMMIFMGPVSGTLSDRFGTNSLSVLGMILTCVGLYSLTSLDQESTVLEIILRLAVLGLGQNFYQSPNLSAAMGSVPRDRLGIAGGIFAATRHLGHISGVAIGGTYFAARQDFFQRKSLRGSISDFTTPVSLEAFQETFLLSFWIAAVGLITALFQKEPEPDRIFPSTSTSNHNSEQ